MIRATDMTADLAEMLETLERVMPLLGKNNQIGVTARPGVEEADYSDVTETLRGTVFERLLRELPFAYGRTRLMRMRPKSCLSIHADPTRRYHFALVTNPGCYIVEVTEENGVFHHILADGRFYEMDAHRTHTAMNSGNKDRYHLVICPADPARPDGAEPLGRRN